MTSDEQTQRIRWLVFGIALLCCWFVQVGVIVSDVAGHVRRHDQHRLISTLTSDRRQRIKVVTESDASLAFGPRLGKDEIHIRSTHSAVGER